MYDKTVEPFLLLILFSKMTLVCESLKIKTGLCNWHLSNIGNTGILNTENIQSLARDAEKGSAFEMLQSGLYEQLIHDMLYKLWICFQNKAES